MPSIQFIMQNYTDQINTWWSVEKFANLAQTTLASGIDVNTTSLTVVDGSAFPLEGYFRILIDDELITVASVSGNNFNFLIRACETGSSVASAHAAGALVTHVRTVESLTASVLQNAPRDIVFGVVGNFSVQTDPPLCNPIQITKITTSTVSDGYGMVLTVPTDNPTVFSICKNVLVYDLDTEVASFSVATTGVVTFTLGAIAANRSFIIGDYLTIFCTSIGTVPGADGTFTLMI